MQYDLNATVLLVIIEAELAIKSKHLDNLKVCLNEAKPALAGRNKHGHGRPFRVWLVNRE